MRIKFLIFCPLIIYACRQSSTGQVGSSPEEVISTSGRTIGSRFIPPKGYKRKNTDPNSFAAYLRKLPLKAHGSPVLYYNGAEKPNDGVYCGVVAMDIGKRDLQQCADAVMRLRAEYLYNTGRSHKIHFNFTNGFCADYSFWANGYRVAVNGNKVNWVSKGPPNNSYETFRAYLETVFTYAGTLSLSKELQPVDYKDMQAGDVLIQGGSPGHAVIVVDVVENDAGKKMYLLAQSYMPAQETQILNNPSNKDISPWYALDTSGEDISTPQWDFKSHQLKRFGA
jgi:hypothetical protein